jgi:methionine-rich copper-binding protein CopC
LGRRQVEKVKRLSTLLAILGITLLLPAGAFANTLVSTDPISGATLKTAPSAVTIITELPLMDEGNEIVVTDPSGARVDDGTLTIIGTEAVVGMRTIKVAGMYRVTYSLLAEGDTPLTGSITFNFSSPVVETPNPTPTPSMSASEAPNLNGSDFGTNLFVIALLLLAIAVTVGMALYARKIFSER